MEKSSTKLSTMNSKYVRGYKVSRLPLGEYLRAMDMIRDMPEEIVQACYPGMDAGQVLAQLKTINKETLTALIVRMVGVVPKEAVQLVAVLTGVPKEALHDDPNIGLDGLAEMIEVFWEINGIENFIKAAERMAARVKAIRGGGSKG